MKLFGVKKGGKVILDTYSKEQRDKFMSKLKDGIRVTIEMKIYRKPKSQEQLGAWFGLFCQTVLVSFDDNGWGTEIIYRLDNPSGIEITPDELKEFMYSACPIFADGKKITMRDMDSQQMTEFFDKCCKYVSSQWGIYIPPPQKDWREKK